MIQRFSKLLLCIVAVALVVASGNVGIWRASQTEVEFEFLEEMAKVTEACHLRCESRRTPTTLSRNCFCRNGRLTVDPQTNLCRVTTTDRPFALRGQLPGGGALAPLLI